MGALGWAQAAMRMLRIAMIAVPIVWSGAQPCPARGQTLAPWRDLVAEASRRFEVPENWIERVIAVESAGHTMQDGRPIRSRKGAMGLMQLMPATWAEMRDRLGLGDDPDDPRDNIMAGTFYLKLMHQRFGYPGLFGAYNAGPVRYQQYLSGRTLPRETRDYLARITVGNAVANPVLTEQDRRLFVPDPSSLTTLATPVEERPKVDPLFAIRRP